MPDNLKTGVIKADLYDPLINRSYAELAAHYDVLIDPARGEQAEGQAPGGAADALLPRLVLPRPRVHLDRGDAGRRGELGHAGRRAPFVSAAARRGAGERVRGCRGRQLKPLPRSVFTLAAWSRPTVGPDIHVKVGKSLYSVPWRFSPPAPRPTRHRSPPGTAASAFLHGPDALFGNVVPLPSTGEVRGLDQDDERLTGEGGVSA